MPKIESVADALAAAASMAWKATRDKDDYDILPRNRVAKIETGDVYTIDYERGRCDCPAQELVDDINASLIGAGLQPNAVCKHTWLLHNHKRDESARKAREAIARIRPEP